MTRPCSSTSSTLCDEPGVSPDAFTVTSTSPRPFRPKVTVPGGIGASCTRVTTVACGGVEVAASAGPAWAVAKAAAAITPAPAAAAVIRSPRRLILLIGLSPLLFRNVPCLIDFVTNIAAGGPARRSLSESLGPAGSRRGAASDPPFRTSADLDLIDLVSGRRAGHNVRHDFH